MAITAATWTVKRSPLSADAFILFIQALVTGDASAGTITASLDVAQYIPNGWKTSFISGFHYTDDAVNRTWGINVTATDWEAENSGGLMAGVQGMLSTYNGFMSSQQNNSCVELPHYMGKLLTATANVLVSCGTNTNTKTYVWGLRFLIKA